MGIRNKIYRIIITALILTASFAFNASAASVQGRIDSVSADSIAGWAAVSGDESEYAEVSIKITDILTGEVVDTITTTANGHRDDLMSMGNKSGDFCFSVSHGWSDYLDGEYYVEASVNGDVLENATSYIVANDAEANTSSKASAANTTSFLGVFKTTAYCPCSSCSEGWGRHTSTGAIASSSHTIAVDPRVIPYGSKVMINGVIYTAEDRGGGVNGNHIDIFYDTHAETYRHGVQYVEVYSVL